MVSPNYMHAQQSITQTRVHLPHEGTTCGTRAVAAPLWHSQYPHAQPTRGHSEKGTMAPKITLGVLARHEIVLATNRTSQAYYTYE
jgi:hypothetical protein